MSRGQAGGGLRSFASAWVVLSARGMRGTLLLLPTPCFCSGLFKSSSWSFLGVVVFFFFFGLFVSFIQNLPLLCMNAVIFSPIQFLCSRSGETRCTHCRKAS